jgi:hypothetical protein
MPLHSPLAHRSSFSCSICNEFVELETARVDEFGQPVHEECYVQKISLKTSIRPPPKVSNAESALSQAITKFFATEEARTVMNFCAVCGSQLEQRNLIFFFEGQSREIRLSICLQCDPIVPSYDA